MSTNVTVLTTFETTEETKVHKEVKKTVLAEPNSVNQDPVLMNKIETKGRKALFLMEQTLLKIDNIMTKASIEKNECNQVFNVGHAAIKRNNIYNTGVIQDERT